MSTSERDIDASPPRLDELQVVLATANHLAAELAGDPLLKRILQAFARLPEPDREPILRIIERDATWCRIAEQTADTTGITVRPNPHASLYVHVFDRVAAPSEPLQRDVDVIRVAMEHFVFLTPLFFQEGVHAQWTAAARELVRMAPPEVSAAVVRLAREVLALIAEGDARAGVSGLDRNTPARQATFT